MVFVKDYSEVVKMQIIGNTTKHVINRKNKVNTNNLMTNYGRVPDMGTAQNTAAFIPISGVHETYQLIETAKNCFVKWYRLEDNNYQTLADEEQLAIQKGWKSFLNSFGVNIRASLFLYNYPINQEEYREHVKFREIGDEHDYLRREENEIISQKIMESRNGTKKEKILVISVQAFHAKKAYKIFCRLEPDMNNTLNRINSSAAPIPMDDALDMLYSIYHMSDSHLIQKARYLNEEGTLEEISSLDYTHIRSMGLTVNDLICPSSMEVKGDYIQIGEKYAKALRVTNLANRMTDTFLNNVTEKDFECITPELFTTLS